MLLVLSYAFFPGCVFPTAQVWLEGLDTQLKTFDVFRLPYSNASRDWIDGQYPGRVTFFKGKSSITVPRYVSEVRAGRQPKCDVWFIDGDHNRGAPLEDLKNSLQAASDGATIIADDCTSRFKAVQVAWRATLATGTIAHSFNRTMNLPPPGGLKGWCVGRYVPRTAGEETSTTRWK